MNTEEEHPEFLIGPSRVDHPVSDARVTDEAGQQPQTNGQERRPLKVRLAAIAREALLVGVMAVVLLAGRSSLADHYVVPTASMEYTLLPGDHVLVNKLAYGARFPFTGWKLTQGALPQRGEIIVFDSPESGKRLIKRTVALGGDIVEVRDGYVWLNHRPTRITPAGADDDLDSEQLGDRRTNLNKSMGGGPEYGPITLDEGMVLVMGDFRGNSRDGRDFGLICVETIYARAIAVFHRRGEGFVWEPL